MGFVEFLVFANAVCFANLSVPADYMDSLYSAGSMVSMGSVKGRTSALLGSRAFCSKSP